MKKLFLFAVIAGSFVACNEPATEETVDTDTIVTEVTETTTTYVAADGDVKKLDGVVMVYQNGEWVAAENDITLDNGVVITTTGEVKSTDGTIIILEEGGTVSKTGQFFDRTGQAIENAWNATKEGVKDAGKAVGDAAGKAADKTEEAVKDIVE